MESVIQWLAGLDVSLLKWTNAMHTPTLDAFMYTLSDTKLWLPLGVVFLAYLFYRKPWQEGALLLLCLGLCILISDQLASGLAKPLVERLRPTHTPELSDSIRVVYGYRGGLYGFFSSHAANYAAVATLLSLIVRRRAHTWLWVGLALLVSYTRMYLGVHYPSDILVGLMTGCVSALVIYKYVYAPVRKKFSPMGGEPGAVVYASGYAWYWGALLAFVPTIAVLSMQTVHILERLGY